MISDYQKFRMKDEGGKNHLLVEVNWNLEDEKTNNCKVLKLEYPNGDTAFVKKEYLNAMLFVIGTEEEQKKLLPQKLVETKIFRKFVEVVATKNIKSGEKIGFELQFTLPSQEREIIGSLNAEKLLKKNPKVLMPSSP